MRSSGRPVSQIAGELGVNHKTPRQWVKAARPESVADSAKGPEIAALRKKVRELEMERNRPRGCAVMSYSRGMSLCRSVGVVQLRTSRMAVRSGELGGFVWISRSLV